jgi:hypothetical protein
MTSRKPSHSVRKLQKPKLQIEMQTSIVLSMLIRWRDSAGHVFATLPKRKMSKSKGAIDSIVLFMQAYVVLFGFVNAV